MERKQRRIRAKRKHDIEQDLHHGTYSQRRVLFGYWSFLMGVVSQKILILLLL